MQAVSRELEARGGSTETAVFGEDAWTPDLLTIDEQAIRRSIEGELEAETRWRLFQSPRTPRLAMSAFMAARRLYRTRRYLPTGTPVDEAHPGFRMVRRLVNIELAHLSLLRAARDSGARWALILEDDATGEPTIVADILHALMVRSPAEGQPLYANVSRSFDEDRLRVAGHLADVGGLPTGGDPTRILAASQPVTNTVCAVLYSGTFLPDLVDAVDRVPMDPVIPIDWKLNVALMDLHRRGAIGPGDCWTLRPAPIVQGSMHT